jgi:type I restriction enzyme S subunit
MGYKQTEVGVIPEDWRCDEVGSFIDLLTGFPFPSSGYSSSGIRLLRGSNVKRGCTDWSDNLVAYWPSVTSEIRKYLLQPDDVVVAMDGSLVGRSFASLGKNDVPALLLQRVARLRSGVVSQAYLKAWMCSQRFTKHCDLVKTTTAIPHISPADIRSFKIAIPPTKVEQEAIAKALSDADSLIESLEQLITKKGHLKQGTMQDLLTGKKRLPGFSGEWALKQLGELCSMKSGAAITSASIDHYSEFPCYGGNGLRGYTAAYTHDGHYALIGRQGALCGNVVIVGGRFFASEHAVVVTPTKETDIQWLAVVLARMNLNQYSESSAQPGLSVSKLLVMSCMTPPLPEQSAIATILADMDAEIAELEAQLAKARTIKKGMLHKLLTGKIRLI